MRVAVLREHLVAALEAAMRTREGDAVALTADRTKAMGVALVGLPDDAEVEPAALSLSTRGAATVLGFHPEHVRRLIRSGRLDARRVGGDYRIAVDALWPLLEARHRAPGRRRARQRRIGAVVSIDALLSRADGSDDMVDLREASGRRPAEDELLWVDIVGAEPEDLEIVRRALGLTDAVVEALAAPIDRPRARVLDGGVEVALLAHAEELDDEPVAIHAVAGDGWVITRHWIPVERLERQRQAVRDQREIGLLSSVQLLLAILDWQLDGFFAAAEQLEREVDDLDEAALRTERDLLGRLVSQRRRIAGARRLAALHHDAFGDIARPDFFPDLDADDARLVRQVSERLSGPSRPSRTPGTC